MFVLVLVLVLVLVIVLVIARRSWLTTLKAATPLTDSLALRVFLPFTW